MKVKFKPHLIKDIEDATIMKEKEIAIREETKKMFIKQAKKMQENLNYE